MTPIKNDRFLRAVRRESIDMTPIWLMRQAGRYLPEYRATRARAGNFMTLCQTPELACEVTLQPLARYALDAAIIFSDILTIPDAMGLGLHFIEGEGPRFSRQLAAADILRLTVPEPEQLAYVYAAIRLVQQELSGRIPLIGFCGSPWTMAAYMIEGGARVGFPKLLQLLRADPTLLHHLLNTLAEAAASHLHHQILAGVQAVMVFDTWGGMLETEDYKVFSLAYLQRVIASLQQVFQHTTVPIILFTKGGSRWLELICDTGCAMIGVDWEISLQTARARVGDRVALQGNLHPEILCKTPAEIKQAVAEVLAAYGPGSGHVFNLGHGITPDVPPEHVSVLVDTVHELSRDYHGR